MTQLILTTEQASLVSAAVGPIEIVDPAGHSVAVISAAKTLSAWTSEEAQTELLKRISEDDGTRLSTAVVIDSLR